MLLLASLAPEVKCAQNICMDLLTCLQTFLKVFANFSLSAKDVLEVQSFFSEKIYLESINIPRIMLFKYL